MSVPAGLSIDKDFTAAGGGRFPILDHNSFQNLRIDL